MNRNESSKVLFIERTGQLCDRSPEGCDRSQSTKSVQKCTVRSIAGNDTIDRVVQKSRTEATVSEKPHIRSIAESDDRSPKKLQRTYSSATVKNPTDILSKWNMRSIAWYRAIDHTSYANGHIVQRGAIDRQSWCDRSQGVNQP